MNNISYFCIVKRFKSNLTALLTALLLLAGNSNKAYAQEPESLPQATDSEMDSVRISLLTCSPGEQVWALYGHTAIRYENPQKGIDIAVNYGIFNFNKPHFLLRFVFGLTDYEMGISSFRDFCEEYQYYGRKVTQQVINLNNEQKRRIISALMKNYQPENRVYRYNYFYDNCTTRARDMLLDNLQDSTHQIVGKDYHEEMTFREMVHSYCTARPWARFGNDMLLGVGADRPTTNEEQQFLPANLMEDFDEMLVSDNKTYDAPLVSDKFTVVNPALRQQEDEGGFPFRPRTCAFLLLAVTIVVTLMEYTTKKTYWGYDLLLMLVSGLAGCVLFLM